MHDRGLKQSGSISQKCHPLSVVIETGYTGRSKTHHGIALHAVWHSRYATTWNPKIKGLCSGGSLAATHTSCQQPSHYKTTRRKQNLSETKKNKQNKSLKGISYRLQSFNDVGGLARRPRSIGSVEVLGRLPEGQVIDKWADVHPINAPSILRTYLAIRKKHEEPRKWGNEWQPLSVQVIHCFFQKLVMHLPCQIPHVFPNKYHLITQTCTIRFMHTHPSIKSTPHVLYALYEVQ